MDGVNVTPYSALACIYDELMKDVDYESWADYIDEIIQTHHADAISVLELACGTGELAFSLEGLDCYQIDASDGSANMIEIANQKAPERGSTIRFFQMDFRNLKTDKKYDAVFSVFDSINYLESSPEVLSFLLASQELLNPGGILIFDFTTPKNSLESVDYLNEDEGSCENVRFFRSSFYHPKERIHINRFEIEVLDEKKVTEKYIEEHKQRIYPLKEMLSIIKQTPYTLLGAYDGFTMREADEESTRITLTLAYE